jgi:transposase-like protein
MVLDHAEGRDSQRAATQAITERIGCAAQRHWVRQTERNQRGRGGLTTDERTHLVEFDRHGREQGCASEILRNASAYFRDFGARKV